METKSVFKGEFEGCTMEQAIESIAVDFEVTRGEIDKYDLLVATAERDGYEGSAWFLLREKKTGKLFENNASHCSCYGFEGQFRPESTSVEYLTSMYKSGSLYHAEILEILRACGLLPITKDLV